MRSQRLARGGGLPGIHDTRDQGRQQCADPERDKQDRDAPGEEQRQGVTAGGHLDQGQQHGKAGQDHENGEKALPAQDDQGSQHESALNRHGPVQPLR